ncbi:MAG: plasmid stabilization protein [Gammaproteobacteria bacterium]|jgi:plasmid stability protein|uniref:FitA-like ribbon-helix-helix domain-containing protein n=1 Tax=Acidiferrobacter sp. SPIII_3 TaxID=1281578 RepID=UPI000D73A10A|nr:plasmid stabilization protein [Acidiferrobacter sp. SPIII_3]AWP24714.1 plasmid stabilization protein [Acidiferrobacter sp. SPIII_3]MDA8118885.1 plasmid stabilization protein [Gammaproteobacteria bacterium]
MASITIRNLDEDIKARLRVRAACRGHSMEEEARSILRAALRRESGPGQNLVERIRARFAPLGDIALPQVEREDPPRSPDFED